MRLSVAFDRLRRQVLDGPGELGGDVRRAAYDAAEMPAEAVAYVDKVRRHAYKVTDRDIAALQAAGWSEEAVFELTVATALGAAMQRIQRAEQAIAEATG